MSNILCAAVSGLSGCKVFLVIVWQTAVFMVVWRMDIYCFPLNWYYYTSFHNYVYNILIISGKTFREILL